MKILKTRLLDKARQDAVDSEAAERKAMVGSGDRSEKSVLIIFLNPA